MNRHKSHGSEMMIAMRYTNYPTLFLLLFLLQVSSNISTSGSEILENPERSQSPQNDPQYQRVLNRFTNLLESHGQYMVVAGCTTPIMDDPNLQRILKPYIDSPNTANLKIEDCV